MALGFTADDFKQFYKPAQPQYSDEQKNQIRQMIADAYSQPEAVANPQPLQNDFVNPNLTEQQKNDARNFILSFYKSNASDGTRPSEIPPTNNITNTIPTLAKPSDAITDKYSKVKESQNAREKAIANSKEKTEEMRLNMMRDNAINSREKAIQESAKKTQIENQRDEYRFKKSLGINDNKADRLKRASKMVAENSVNVNDDNVVETASRLMNPDYIKSTNKDYYDYELKQAKKSAKDFEKEHEINLNSVSDINIKKIQDLVRSGEISQDEVDAYRSILYRNTLTEDLANGVASFGGTFAKPATAIGGIFDPNMRDTNLELNQRLEDVSNTSPLASGVGNFAGMMANYQMANGVLDNVIPFDNALANLGKGQLADTVVSEIPQLITNAQSGKYNDDNGNLDIKALAKDYRNMAASDFAFNAVPEFFSQASKLVGNIPSVNIPTKSSNNVSNTLTDVTKALNDNGVDNSVKQIFKKSMSNKEIDNILKNKELRTQFENEYGITLSGTMSEQRNAVKRALKEVGSDDYADAIEQLVKENTAENTELPRLRNVDEDDATREFMNAQQRITNTSAIADIDKAITEGGIDLIATKPNTVIHYREQLQEIIRTSDSKQAREQAQELLYKIDNTIRRSGNEQTYNELLKRAKDNSEKLPKDMQEWADANEEYKGKGTYSSDNPAPTPQQDAIRETIAENKSKPTLGGVMGALGNKNVEKTATDVADSTKAVENATENVTNGAKNVDNATNETVADTVTNSVKNNKVDAPEVSAEAKKIFRQKYENRWRETNKKAKSSVKKIERFLNSYDATDEQKTEINESIDKLSSAMENMQNAKTFEDAQNSFKQAIDVLNEGMSKFRNLTKNVKGRDIELSRMVKETKSALSGKWYVSEENVSDLLSATKCEKLSELNKKLKGTGISFTSNESKATKKLGNLIEGSIDDNGLQHSRDTLDRLKDTLGDSILGESNSVEDKIGNAVNFITGSKGNLFRNDTISLDERGWIDIGDEIESAFQSKLKQMGYTASGDKLRLSDVYTNTLTKNATSEEMARYFETEDYMKKETHWGEQCRSAINRIQLKGEEKSTSDIIAKSKKTSWTGDDTMEAMLLYTEKMTQARMAEQAGEDASGLYSEASKLFREVYKQASSEGEALNVIRAWNKNTPQGKLAEELGKIRASVDAKHLGVKNYSKKASEVADKVNDIVNNAKDIDDAKENLTSYLMSLNLQFFGKKKNVTKAVDSILDVMKKGDYNDDEIRRVINKYTDNIELDGVTEANIMNLIKDSQDMDELLKNLPDNEYDSKESLRDMLYVMTGKTIDRKVSYEHLVNMAKRQVDKNIGYAAKMFSDVLPEAKFSQKLKSTLYDNMLASIKTMLTRNLGSNAIYNTLETAQRPIKVGVDYLTSKVTKNRAYVPSLTRYKEGAKGFAKGVENTIGDYTSDIKTGRSGQKSFGEIVEEIANSPYRYRKVKGQGVIKGTANVINNTFAGYDKTVRSGMELGDRPIYEATYNSTKEELSQLVKKYGDGALRKGIKSIDDSTKSAADYTTDELIDIFSKTAGLQSVMQNKSDLSKGMENFRTALDLTGKGVTGKKTGLLSQTTIPFVQVAANVLDRTADYIPGLGLGRNIVRSIGESKNGAFNQRRFVDELTHQLTGLGLTAGALGLANSGKISDAYSEDADKRKAQQDADYQEYAYIDDEGNYHDYNDIPVLGALMQGGKVFYDAVDEKNGWNKDGIIPTLNSNVSPLDVAKGIGGSLNAISQDALWQGLSKITGSNGYGSGNIVDNMVNTVLGGGNQGIASVIGQYAQYSDDYKRDLGDYNTPEYFLNLVNNKLPGSWDMANTPFANVPVIGGLKGREALPIKYDTSGNPIKNDTGFGETFIYPYKETTPTYSESFDEAQRLEDATQSKTAYNPRIKKSDLTETKGYDANSYTHEDLYKAQQYVGKPLEDAKKTVYNTDFYKSLSPDEQLAINEQLNSSYKALGKEKIVRSKYTEEEVRQMESNDEIYTKDDKYTNKLREGDIDGFLKIYQDDAMLDKYGVTDNKRTKNIINNSKDVDGDMEVYKRYTELLAQYVNENGNNPGDTDARYKLATEGKWNELDKNLAKDFKKISVNKNTEDKTKVKVLEKTETKADWHSEIARLKKETNDLDVIAEGVLKYSKEYGLNPYDSIADYNKDGKKNKYDLIQFIGSLQ